MHFCSDEQSYSLPRPLHQTNNSDEECGHGNQATDQAYEAERIAEDYDIALAKGIRDSDGQSADDGGTSGNRQPHPPDKVRGVNLR